jgi:superfamily II RNA helicase
MLHIIDPSTPFEGELDTPYEFPLDNFQKYAMKAISMNENVLVTAKTGSGKTLVGEYQIHHSLNKGKKVIMTTPIKSLSNQKFNDLKKIYGKDKVGIITGDIKFQPQASVLVMTTEILRNLLYKQGTTTQGLGICANVSLEELDAVIFDEVHYINDRDRGKVWEEALILLNPEVNLVLLSATINHPEIFAGWLAKIKQKPIHLISTTYRIVPLTHYIFDIGAEPAGFIELINKNNKYNVKAYEEWLRNINKRIKANDEHKEAVKAREKGQDVVSRTFKKYAPGFVINKCVEYLNSSTLLPALFFIFSRDDCERYARCIEKPLIDTSDVAAVQNIVDFHLHRHMDKLEHLEQYYSIKELLRKGVAYHHSGLLPVLKEIIEVLFNKGLIKVLFATETFSVGINMPTKTAVFLDLYKYDDFIEDFRILNTAEYTQMAGRAGRRGIDELGTVVYLPVKEPIPNYYYKTMAVGKMPSFESRMEFGYDFILKLLHKGVPFESITELTFDFYNRQLLKKELEEEIESNIKKQAMLNIDIYLPDLLKKMELDNAIKSKQIQQEISAWNNKHIGPKWSDAIKKFGEWKQLKFFNERSQERLLTLFNTEIDKNIQDLKDIGFVSEDNTLTDKGTIATEINQADPIILSELYTSGILDTLSSNEILGAMSIFLDKSHSLHYTDNRNVNNVYTYIIKFERKYSKLWCDPVIDWSNGKLTQEICSKYDLHPGNLYRTLMGLSNIIDELHSVAVMKSNVGLLDKLVEAKQLLVRDIAISESLYLYF